MSKRRPTKCSSCGAKLGEARMVVHDADPTKPSGDYCNSACLFAAREAANRAKVLADIETIMPVEGMPR